MSRGKQPIWIWLEVKIAYALEEGLATAPVLQPEDHAWTQHLLSFSGVLRARRV